MADAAKAAMQLDKCETFPVFFHCSQKCSPFGINRCDGRMNITMNVTPFKIDMVW